MVYSGQYRRGFRTGLYCASADTAIPHRPSVSLDLHDLGIHLLGDTFRDRNFPPFSDGRDSFSDRGSRALRLDAFERRSASDAG